MKKLFLLLTVAVVLVSCQNKTDEETKGPAKPEAEEQETISVTDWTDRTELFMEYPPLVVGQTARFAVHFTAMGTLFTPVKSGAVDVILDGPGGPQKYSVSGPSRPGIFGVDVKPTQAGSYTMIVRLRSSSLNDSHSLGSVTVYPDEKSAAAYKAPAAREEPIAFLKEQQWSLEFATARVAERAERESFVVAGQVQPRAGGQGEVSAPLDGRVVEAVAIPTGATVNRGQIIARIAPPVNNPGDRPALELARSEAEQRLQFAVRDRERAERLVNAGAVPSRRLEEAKSNVANARTRLTAAEANLSQYEANRQAGTDSPSRLFAVRTPISGSVIESKAISGANVRAGDMLLRVVDTSMLYVMANVSESDLPRLRRITGAEVVTSDGQTFPAGKLVSTGRVVDPASRTIPVIYQMANPNLRLAVGQAVSVRLFTSGTTVAPAIPESAIVDDAGRPVAFVQLGGEAFTRRPVKLGPQQNGYVQVTEGIRAGERVVTKGAYLIRLSAMSSSIPAHGHVH
jgi:membrane fusion protein, heavy metal efflux system